MKFLNRNIKKQFTVNLLSSYSSMIITMGIQLLLVPFIIMKIGLEAYGLYALFIFFSISGGMALLDLGLQGTVVKFLSNKIAGGDKIKITSFIFESLSLFVLLGLIFSLLLLIFGVTISSYIFNIPGRFLDFLPTFFMLASASLLIDFVFIGLVANLESLVRKDLVELLRILKTSSLAIFIILRIDGYGLYGVLLSYFFSNVLTTFIGFIIVIIL